MSCSSQPGPVISSRSRFFLLPSCGSFSNMGHKVVSDLVLHRLLATLAKNEGRIVTVDTLCEAL